MQTHVSLNGRPLTVILSNAAQEALIQRKSALLAEMELYFSCLIRLKVRFHDAVDAIGDSIIVTDKLQIRFHPVMTAQCDKDYPGDEPPLTDFPIVNPASFTPKWLQIDYARGNWKGEFGYRNER